MQYQQQTVSSKEDLPCNLPAKHLRLKNVKMLFTKTLFLICAKRIIAIKFADEIYLLS